MSAKTDEVPPDGEKFNTESWEKIFAEAKFTPVQIRYYLKLFEQHSIKLDMIQDLTHELLLSMGIWKAGHRISILRLKDKVFDPEGEAEIASASINPSPILLSRNNIIRRQTTLQPTLKPNPRHIQTNKSTSFSVRIPNTKNTPNEIPPKRHSHGYTEPANGDLKSSEEKKLITLNQENELEISPASEIVPYPEKEVNGDSKQTGPSIQYFLNDVVGKHRVFTNEFTVQNFGELVRKHDKVKEEFAVFTVAPNEFNQQKIKLLVVKDDYVLSENEVYYVIENSKVATLRPKIEKRAQKDMLLQQFETGREVLTSINRPMQIAFVPDDDLFINQHGRIGLCMAPGRKKKKKNHDWDRDLSMDLDRIRYEYGCDVLVSLIRHSELQELKISNLFQEVESRGMDSIHFPIKDKWIPHSMDDLIKNVDHIIQLLKHGKTVVCHCNGGKGRSGTVVVATLVGLGHKVQSAIDIVRKARSGTIRNPIQIYYVKRFKTAWLQYVKKKYGTVTEESDDAYSEEPPNMDKDLTNDPKQLDNTDTPGNTKKKEDDDVPKRRTIPDEKQIIAVPQAPDDGKRKFVDDSLGPKAKNSSKKTEKEVLKVQKEHRKQQKQLEKLTKKEEKIQKKLSELQSKKQGPDTDSLEESVKEESPQEPTLNEEPNHTTENIVPEIDNVIPEKLQNKLPKTATSSPTTNNTPKQDKFKFKEGYSALRRSSSKVHEQDPKPKKPKKLKETRELSIKRQTSDHP